MAKLPAYQPNPQLGTGLETTRPNAPSNDIASGLSTFGQGLEKFGLAEIKLQGQALDKAARQAEKDDNVRLTALSLSLGQDLRREFYEKQAAITEGTDPTGFTAGLTQRAQADAEKTAREVFGHRADQDYVRLKFAQAVEPILTQAAHFEATRMMQWRAGTANAKIADLTANIALNPTKDQYDSAVAEFSEFVHSSIGGDPRVGESFLNIGAQKLQKAFLDASFARDPVGASQKVATAFANQPTRETRASNPMATAIIEYANRDNTVPAQWLLAMGWIESKLNANAPRPIGPDGKPASSADGGWQIIDAMKRSFFGNDPRNWPKVFDPKASTEAVGGFLSRAYTQMKERGIEPTPGTTYMMWNLGEGLAWNVLRADPNASIQDVIHKTYDQTRGVEFANKVIANNPSLYRAGMTVAEVRANYEAKVGNAISATQGFLTQSNNTSDENARTVMADLLGFAPDKLTAADLAETFTKGQAALRSASAKEKSVAEGLGILNGDRKADPYSETDHKAVNAAVLEAKIADGVAAGDMEALLKARRVAETAGFVPQPIMNAYRAAINGKGQNPGKVAAYRTLAGLEVENPGAFDATRIPPDEKERIKEFRVWTEQVGLSDAAAIERIEFRRTPDGQQAAKRNHDVLKRDLGVAKDRELADRTWSEVSKAFDQNWYSSPTPISDNVRGSAVQAYQAAYVYWREKDYSVDDARAMAIDDMKNTWGVSNLMGGLLQSGPVQTLMPYPPEKVLREKGRVGGSFDWVAEQARNQIEAFLQARADIVNKLNKSVGPRSTGAGVSFGLGMVLGDLTPKQLASSAQFQLIPTADTAADKAAGLIPRYQL